MSNTFEPSKVSETFLNFQKQFQNIIVVSFRRKSLVFYLKNVLAKKKKKLKKYLYCKYMNTKR